MGEEPAGGEERRGALCRARHTDGAKRMLILSRTGKQAVAKNNKPEEGKEDDETPLMKETRAALRKNAQSLIPRTPPRPGPQPGAAATEAAAVEDEGAAEDEGEEDEEDEAEEQMQE